MKVLFLPYRPAASELSPDMVSDYQSDMLYHGLAQLDDIIVHEQDYQWWMFARELVKRYEDWPKIWGKGFTIYGTLQTMPDIYDVNRLLNWIREKRYDAIIIPLHHTWVQDVSTLNMMLGMYKNYGYEKNQLIVIDGWDRPEINADLRYCTYYKRELYDDREDVKPISFAFPADKIINPKTEVDKNKECGTIVPVNCSIDESYRRTYIFDSEESYYKDYRQSLFGLTSKKGGWDTLRHYEIIANGCVPVFHGLDRCPERTLHNFPKELCKKVMELPFSLNWGNKGSVESFAGIDIDNPLTIDQEKFDIAQYTTIRYDFITYMKEHLTTKKLAEYVLGNI